MITAKKFQPILFILAIAGMLFLQLSGDRKSPTADIHSIGLTSSAWAAGAAPVANAGRDRRITIGRAVVVDGWQSSDPEGDPVTFSWSFVSKPTNSNATFANATLARPSFTPDLAGDYEVQLIVNDGTTASAPDSVTFSTDNARPTANAGPDRKAALNQVIVLDAAGSTEPDGSTLSYSWTLLQKPALSTAAISDASGIQPTITVDVAGDYIAQLTVSDGTLTSDPDTVLVTTGNVPPVAMVNDGMNVDLKYMDPSGLPAYGCTDLDGDRLAYSWSILYGGGTVDVFAEVDASVAIGSYGSSDDNVLQLTIDDGTAQNTTTILITNSNFAPTAAAGPDQAITAGQPVSLDGGGSYDLNKDEITYRWALISAPSGSNATIDNVTTARPEITPDVPGTYVAQLIVDDGAIASTPDTVVLSTGNIFPVAEAGLHMSFNENATATLQLDGTGSGDANGDALTYRWSVLESPNPQASFSDPTSPTPTYDALGQIFHRLQLVVSDGVTESLPDTLTIISGGESEPTADAGADQTLAVPGSVQLDASGSHFPCTCTPNPDYDWALIHKPEGSTATLSDSSIVNPTFAADKPGVYVVQLGIEHGFLDLNFDIDTVVITVNSVPVADAGPDRTVAVSTTVQLDGADSFNPSGDPFTYAWTLTQKPASSTTVLTGANTATPSFLADVLGTYVAQLVTNDGTDSSAPDSVTIVAVDPEANQPPVANAGPDQAVTAGATIALDGAASTDDGGVISSFAWTLTAKPDGSTAVLSSAVTANSTFVADKPGIYTAELVVGDGLLTSTPDNVTITATSTVNQPPVLNPVGNQTVDLGTTLTLTLGASDPESDPLRFGAIPLPLLDGASLDATTGVFQFTPDTDQVGAIALTFTVSDGISIDSEAISITVAIPTGPSATSLVGTVLDTNAAALDENPENPISPVPVVGAQVRMRDAAGVVVAGPVNSNTQGAFSLKNIPATAVLLDINGSTANVAPDGATYASFREKLSLIADVPNVEDRPFFLPRIDTTGAAIIDPAGDTVVNNTALGLQLTVAANSAFDETGTPISFADNVQITVSEVPLALAPATLPKFMKPGLLISIQPVGLTFNPPAQITFPNRDMLPVGAQADLWSLDAKVGDFAVVGRGVVEIGGTSIATVSGGIRASTWHAFVPPPPVKSADKGSEPTNPKSKNKKGEKKKKTGSSTAMKSGNLSVEHRLPGYSSMGEQRALTFVYNSTSANPRATASFDMSIRAQDTIPPSMSAQVAVNGISSGQEIFINSSGLSETAGHAIRQSVSFDASGLSTGRHRFGVEAAYNYTASRLSTTELGSFLVNNQTESAFGAGWTLAGLQRLHINGSSLALTDGDGSILEFDGRSTGLTFNRVNFGGPFDNFNVDAVAVGDFNKDGVSDFAKPISFLDPTGRRLAKLTTYFGDENGQFAKVRDIAIPDLAAGNQSISGVSTGDFNNDGNPDFVVSAYNTSGVPSTIMTIAGAGGGYFRPPQIGFSFSAGRVRSIPVADIDGDGNDDVVALQIGLQTIRPKIHVLYGDGTGAFPVARQLIIDDAGAGASGRIGQVSVADFNGDGRPDIVTVAELSTLSNTGQIVVRLNNGDGTFSAPIISAASDVFAYADNKSFAIADVNRDGVLDILTQNITSEPTVGIKTHLGDNNGAFTTTGTFDTGRTPTQKIEVADIDADGIADIVTRNGGSNNDVSILPGAGDAAGNFGAPTHVAIVDGPSNSVTDSLGVGDFNGDGLLDIVTEEANLGVIFRTETAQPAPSVSPPGDFSKLTKNTNGSFTRTMKDGARIEFNDQGLQTSFVDRNGNTTSYVHGLTGLLETITGPAGKVTTLGYTSGKLSSVTAAGQTTLFSHDGAGNLEKITDPDGSVRRFVYDNRHLLLSQLSKREFATGYTYGFNGENTGALLPDGTTRVVAPQDTRALFDTSGGIGSKSTPGPVTLRSSAQAAYTDGNNQLSTFGLDIFGLEIESTDALSRTTSITRDDNGLITQFVAPSSAATEMTYDGRGNIVALKEAVGTASERETLISYTDDGFNQIASITDPNKNPPATLQYDANGNLIETINAAGIRTIYAYGDANCPGRVTSITKAIGLPEEAITGFAHDPVTCYVVQITDPRTNPTTFTHDAAGNVTQMTDALGRSNRYFFDSMNRRFKVVDARNTDLDPLCATTGVTCIAYDTSGRRAAITDASGNVTQFAYDEHDRVNERTDPLGITETFSYDGNGNLRFRTDRKGQTVEFQYDNANRMSTQIILPGAPGQKTRNYGYDDVNNLTSVSDPDSALTFTYNLLDQLETASTTGAPFQPGVTLTYTYDKNGKRKTLTDPTGQQTYGYDTLSRLTGITDPLNSALDPAVGLGYDPLNRRTSVTRPNGVNSTLGYDTMDNLTSSVHAGITTVSSFTYVYNAINIRQSLTQARTALTVASLLDYGYDPTNQLTSASDSVSGLPITFDYDGAGNRLRRNGGADNVIGGGNRLLEDDQFTYSYDANGQMETKTDKATSDVTTFTYDAENQLVHIAFTGGGTADYRYDGLGRRIEKDVNGAITRYVYDAEDILLEYDGTNTLVARYTHGPGFDDPLLMARDLDSGGTFAATEQFAYHSDGLGSITDLTDSTGASVRAYTHNAYGGIAAETGTLTNPYGYTGREFDAESGLLYYRARYYDAAAGRFLKEDPIGFDSGDPNHYRYVFNNPANFTDPSGLKTGCIEKSVCGIVEGTKCLNKNMGEALETILESRMVFGMSIDGKNIGQCVNIGSKFKGKVEVSEDGPESVGASTGQCPDQSLSKDKVKAQAKSSLACANQAENNCSEVCDKC